MTNAETPASGEGDEMMRIRARSFWNCLTNNPNLATLRYTNDHDHRSEDAFIRALFGGD